MKKSLFPRLALMAVLMAFVSACSEKQEYTNVIPANVSTVVSINVKSLVDKAGLNDKENKEAQQKLIDALKSGMNAATFQQVEMIMKDPKKSGIDVSAPMYVFSAEAFPYTTVVAKVSNEDDLHALLETLEKEKICQPLASGDGFQFTQMNNQVLLAYTPSVLMLTNYSGTTQLDKIKQAIPTLLKQTSENSVVSTSAFKKMQKMGGDIDVLFSPASFLGAYTSQLNFGLPQNINLKDMQILGSLSFDKGKISMKYENFTENPELQAMFDKQKKATCAIENSFLKYFPKSTLMYLSMGINGEEFYNLLLENQEFQKNFSISKANEVKELFGTFQKDVAVGLINVTMNNAPTFLLYANVKSAAPVQMLYEKKGELGLKRGEDILKLGENEYVYKSSMLNVFFGVRDNNLYATNDEMLYKSIDKAVNPSIKDTEFASNIKGKHSAFVINAEAILGLPVVKMLGEYGGTQYATAIALVDKVAYMEAVGDPNNNAEMVIQLKDKNVNALKQIVNFIKEFAGI
ncbi:DUF4836 family protein [Bacteroides oleiciplenus]|uniref:DUF4836 domain-containing protein n=2 Tax=Bacteroides oleiciplenus TaxID=626931 RepID=K9EJZ0_9BACE|nr:DUF4836 family protein [Bacteroides oleiciplenus]EKU91257.1 hypothetical protein HMPREF9447_01447 [Bacteroides oleiciplenus YIT 12058]RGN35227.1 DUF4836 family protein [Bacteroides oleiciplenus]